MPPHLKIENLTKIYPNGVKALDGVNLDISPGMFGLLGPNGAGKSTLMRTIATLQNPDAGTMAFGALNILNEPLSLRKILGYLPQEFGVYSKISAEDLLDYFALLKGISSKKERKQIIHSVLEMTNLLDVRHKHVDAYSGGMRQRFGIAQLLLNNPQLIIVDEPTAGLDPAERSRFLNVLREISANNVVIFSTHIVDDVKDLCQEMAVMDGGRVLVQGAPEKLVKALNGKIWTHTILQDQLEQAETDFKVISSKYNHQLSLSLRIYAEERPGTDFAPAEPQLEDVYFLALKKHV